MKTTNVNLKAFSRPAAGERGTRAVRRTDDALINLLTKFVTGQVVTDEGRTGDSFGLRGGVGTVHDVP